MRGLWLAVPLLLMTATSQDAFAAKSRPHRKPEPKVSVTLISESEAVSGGDVRSYVSGKVPSVSGQWLDLLIKWRVKPRATYQVQGTGGPNGYFEFRTDGKIAFSVSGAAGSRTQSAMMH
jgi:hypothetical protein